MFWSTDRSDETGSLPKTGGRKPVKTENRGYRLITGGEQSYGKHTMEVFSFCRN